MFIKLLKIPFLLCALSLSACISSTYPLLKKETSVSLIQAGEYCFVRKDITVIQDSQCGFARVNGAQNNGYTYKITRDGHKYATESGSSLKVGDLYHARIHNAPVEKGPMRGWYILQSCKSSKACDYFGVRTTKSGFDVAVPSMQDSQNRLAVKSLPDLLSLFSGAVKAPARVVSFHSRQYLMDQSRARAERKRQIRDANEGDL